MVYAGLFSVRDPTKTMLGIVMVLSGLFLVVLSRMTIIMIYYLLHPEIMQLAMWVSALLYRTSSWPYVQARSDSEI